MSHFEDRNWAKFVFQHCSANIKASAQGSSWKFKIGLSRNQVESRGSKVVEARGQKFSTARLTSILSGSNRWNQDSLNWCLSENIINLWQVKNCKLRPNVRTRCSTILHLDYFFLKKHLLRKEKNLSLPTTYIVFKGKSLFLRLLKVAFFARQKSQTVFISPFLSPSDGRFRISLKPFSLWLLKVATMEIMPFWLVRVSQKLLSHQKADFGQRLWLLLLTRTNKNFIRSKRFIFYLH